jgi:hypothetical protein
MDLHDRSLLPQMKVTGPVVVEPIVAPIVLTCIR